MASDRLSDMDLTALADLDDSYMSSSPISPMDVGRTLNTPPGPTVGVGTRPTVPPSVVAAPPGPTIGVGTRTTAGPSNVTMGVGTTMALRRLAGRPTTGQKTVPGSTPRGRPTTGGKQPRRVPRQNTPTSDSNSGSRRRSSGSGGSNRSRRGGSGGGGGGSSGGSSGGSTPSPPHTPSPGPSRGRGRRSGTYSQEDMQQQLEEILRRQQMRSRGRHIAGVTTTNTITTTYKNGRRPTVARNSTSVRN